MNLEPLHSDIARLKEALEGREVAGAFMNAPSPGIISLFQPTSHYPTQDSYLEALAEAMRPEYEAIVETGLTLQLDAPDLGLGCHTLYKDRSQQDYLKLAERHVEVINHALRNIPADSVRMHLCWGNYEGPHHCDIEMELLLPVVLKAKPRRLLFETANPRHQHDWAVDPEIVWAKLKTLAEGAAIASDRLWKRAA